MRKLLVPFILFDKGFQKIVNHIAFFLMRRLSFDKPFVRYLFITILILAMGVEVVVDLPNTDMATNCGRILALLLPAVMGLALLRHERGLAPGVRSIFDEVSTRNTGTGIGFRIALWTIDIFIFTLAVLGYIPVNLSTIADLIFLVLAYVSQMSIIYVTDTPDEPPVKHTAPESVQESVKQSA